MSKKSNELKHKNEEDISPSIETLSVVNAVQFCAALVRGIFIVGRAVLLAIGRAGIFFGSIIVTGLIRIGTGVGFCGFYFFYGIEMAISSVLRIIGWLVRGFFSAVNFVAIMISRVLAWCIVSALWGMFFIIHGLFSNIWKVISLVCYHIPRFFVLGIIGVIRFIVRSFQNVADECIIRIAAIPGDIGESAHDVKNSFSLPAHWMQRMAIFVGIAVLFIVPFPAIRSYQFLNDVRADTERASIDALSLLEQGKNALAQNDIEKANTIFEQSKSQFEQAEKTMSSVPAGVLGTAKLVPFAGRKIGDGERLILIGKDIANSGVVICDIIKSMTTNDSDKNEFFPHLSNALSRSDEAYHFLKDADTLIAQINPESIPNEYNEPFSALAKELHAFVETADQIMPARDTIMAMLGSYDKRRYLLVFQNNTELRPTGGFLGSYALIDVNKGQLEHVEIPGGGTYDLQGSLYERVQSPFPLHIVNPSWQFQDSNWFPDFPTSAKKMVWFYDKSGGPTVDGVIALNASFFQKILQVIGSIDMSQYGKELTADNFFLETQKAVELEYNKTTNTPKAFIADLFPKTLDKMNTLSNDKKNELIATILTAFVQKDIQLFMRDEHEEKIVQEFGVGGEMRNAPLDYFSLVEANVGGGKGEGVILEEVNRDTIIRENGTIEVHVTIHRKHNGNPTDPFGGVRNVSYLRFYLPKGTRALSATGFRPPDISLFKQPLEGYRQDDTLVAVEGAPALDPATGLVQTTEFGRSVFAHWIVLNPKEEATAEVVFLLPFTVKDIPLDRNGNRLYTLLVQRQSGSTTRSFAAAFHSDGRTRFISSTPEDAQHSDHLLSIVLDPFVHDQVLGITFHE